MRIPSPGSRLTCFAVFAFAFAAPAVAADTLIDNVNGITLDEAGKLVRFSGLVMSGDGKVIRLVTAKEAPPPPPAKKAKKGEAAPAPYRPDYRIDGKGRTMLPGLIDAHGHVMSLGFQALTLDLAETASLAEAQAKIAAYAKEHGSRRWIVIGGNAPTAWLYGDRLRMGGVKLYADGALGSRGAWLKAPYADSANNRGLQFVGDTKLRNLMSRAALDGYQIAIHAIGDAANAQALDAYSELESTYKGDRRWRIEHAQIVDPADIPRFAHLGVIASMQPVHQTSDRTMAEARLGPGRLKGAYAWKSLIVSGAHPLGYQR